MSNPRNTTDYTDIDPLNVTYAIDNSTIVYSATEDNGSAQVGLAVTFSADRTVALTADGNRVVGKLIKVEADNKATVQTEGYVQLPGGASASLTVGKAIVGALGASSARGYIREVATATAAELGVCRGEIVDNDTATAVWVKL
jgi:hypothetical protein